MRKPLPGETAPRLDASDKEEWRDVARLVRPDITDAEFEADWLEFLEAKRRHALH